MTRPIAIQHNRNYVRQRYCCMLIGMSESATCTKCRNQKPREEFYRSPYGGPFPRQPCKECHRENRRTRYREKGGIDEAYAQVLKRDYGLTLEQYNALLRLQANRCAICERPETDITRKTGKVRRLSVDHDHATDTVRALLCKRCNVIVWALEDNADRLQLAKEYIDLHRRRYGME